MINVSKEKEIYAEIQRRLFYIIPERWESIHLYASVIEKPDKRLTRRNVFLLFPKRDYQKKGGKSAMKFQVRLILRKMNILN